MNEKQAEAPDAQAQFDLLGQIVDRLGHGAMAQTLAVAGRMCEQGLAGPTVTEPLSSDAGPAYALAFNKGEVSFAYGGEGGKLPVAALDALVQRRAAAEAQQS